MPSVPGYPRDPDALHSRGHRPDCKQLVVGLVLNRDGFAITHEIFAGNAQDRATLATMLDRLGERVDLNQGSTSAEPYQATVAATLLITVIGSDGRLAGHRTQFN